jgi:NADH-quinone oxidoreductase subunit L
MFLAAGLGASTAAIFHVMTHAFFKALLFLGAGSVIHALGGVQDMRQMGGLGRRLPQTRCTFWIGCLAIAGIPPFAGFFSKDEILHSAAAGGAWILWIVGLATAAITAFYMFRAYYMTFSGSFRGTRDQEHHLHESPPSMVVPLWILAVGAVLAGLVGIPRILTFGVLTENRFGSFLEPVIAEVGQPVEHAVSAGLEWGLIVIAIAVALLGWFLAWSTYAGDRGLARAEARAARFPAVHRVLVNKYWVDELYDATVVRGVRAAARGLFRFDASFLDGLLVNGARHATVAFSLVSGLFDKYVVDGLVNLVGHALGAGSRLFRRVQTGSVGSYALVLALGMFTLVCMYMVLRQG